MKRAENSDNIPTLRTIDELSETDKVFGLTTKTEKERVVIKQRIRGIEPDLNIRLV